MSSETLSKSGRPIRFGPYPELTLQAILVGYVIGAIIAISIGSAALKLGFSIEGSELAAILGFGVLRGVMGRRSIIENNINQSVASAVNAASSGMMFSVPALFILGYNEFNVPLMVVGCITGAVLGIAFIIPLRKQMIDFERLPYPGGIAVATILKSPGAGATKAKVLIAGAAVSALVHTVVYQLGGQSNLGLGAILGLPDYLNFTLYVSLMTVGVGYLSGRGGVYFVIGGYVCYWILAPILQARGLMPGPEVYAPGLAPGESPPASALPGWLNGNLFRPVGIGMLIGGALSGVLLAFPLIVSAVRSMQQAAKSESRAGKDEMPIRYLYMAVAGAFVVLFVIAQLAVPEMTFARGAMMALLGTLWIWVAGVILSECIGRTNWSPLSGMTLIGITILLFVASYKSGMTDGATVVASVIVGAAMCVAMSQATDLMLDLKTGYLVGAIPRRQQIAQMLGTWLGPIVIMALIFVLHSNEPLGGAEYPAPQGQALASMINGILGGEVPTQKYLAGAGLGALLSLSGVGGLGVLVGLGFYLPFNIVLTYTVGTILRVGGDKVVGRAWGENFGIPIAAGLIVGEALVGVVFAVYKVFLS